MSNTSIAINKTEINKLMLEIIDYSNQVKIIFNKINDLMYDAKTFYDSSSAKILFNKYSLISSNYNKVVANIMSYNTDLSNLKKKYASGIGDLSEEVRSSANKVAGAAPEKYQERR